jgi:NAD(P)H dehydrogenase (quinone)
MAKKILLVNGHPRVESLCGALAASYAEAAREAGHELRTLTLAALSFDPVLHGGFKAEQPLEPALQQAQADITWADHLVFVYPVWWAAPPALLKGFVDRALLPGFAFKYRQGSSLWDKLLTGKTGRLIVTADSPGWYLRLVTGNPAVKSMKRGVLEFCGVSPVRTLLCAGVKGSSAPTREGWLRQARALGASAA